RTHGISLTPCKTDLANTIEAIVNGIYREDSPDWNAFWIDTEALLNRESAPLVRKKVLLGTDGVLHSNGDDCAVFFIPRQGSLDEGDLDSETAIQDIPSTLSPYLAFLSEKIRLYDEKNARVQTQVRRFLDSTLVNRFRVEDI